jgi:hypothetical protein
MGGKFSLKLEVLVSWILLNKNFLKREQALTPMLAGKISRSKYFPNCFLDSVPAAPEISLTPTLATATAPYFYEL